MHRLAVIAATAAMLIADQSQAQTTDNLLRGLSKIKLVIERLEADDRVCGLTEEALRAAAMFPLSSAKVEVTPAAPAYLYVNLLTLYLAPVDLCVSNIQMQVLSYQSVTLDFSGEEKLAVVELWNGGSIYSSARANHLRRISEVIDGRTKKFLTDWNLDNRTRPRPAPTQSETIAEPTVSLGTGFAITPTGDLVTNEHVVSNCSTVTVKQGKREFIGTISFRDSAADLALIHLNRETPTGIPANLLPPPPFATLRQSPAVKPGEQVIAYGFPLRGALADEGNLTIGNVSAMRGLNNDPNEIQISAPVQPGNSGGPLLDSSGNVIGVVASKLDALNALVRSGDLPQNVNFAISLPVLKAFLARSGARATESASRLELRPDEVGDRAKSFTYAIECNPQPSTQSQSTGGWEVISRRPAAPDPQLTPRTADPPRTVKTVEIKSDRLLPSGIGTNERLIVVSKGQTLSTILGGIGATGADIAVIAAVLGSYGSALRQGDKLRILLPEGERARPARVVVLGANGKVKAAAALSDSGKYFSVDLSTAGALE